MIPEPLATLTLGLEVMPIDVCERSPEVGVLFTSDNFPGNYNQNTNCNYTMRAEPGKRVQLTFFLFYVSNVKSILRLSFPEKLGLKRLGILIK